MHLALRPSPCCVQPLMVKNECCVKIPRKQASKKCCCCALPPAEPSTAKLCATTTKVGSNGKLHLSKPKRGGWGDPADDGRMSRIVRICKISGIRTKSMRSNGRWQCRAQRTPRGLEGEDTSCSAANCRRASSSVATPQLSGGHAACLGTGDAA